MEYLTLSQIAELQQLLLEQSKNLRHRLDLFEQRDLAFSVRESIGELSCYDNHPADIATEVFEQSKSVSLKENAEAHLREVDDALARITAHNYDGLCIHCGQPIPFERLLVIPETLFCIAHVPERDVSQDRSVEEHLLPLSEHYSIDERNDENLNTQEDTWKIVENWGNSDSPAMSWDREILDYDDMVFDTDENDDDYVEPFEGFIATDIYGSHATFVRNKAYRKYMAESSPEPDH